MGKEMQRLRDLCAEMFEVVGVYAEMCDTLEDAATLRVLDNLDAATHAKKLPYATVLPFAPQQTCVAKTLAADCHVPDDPLVLAAYGDERDEKGMTEGQIREVAFQFCTAAGRFGGDAAIIHMIAQLITESQRLLLLQGIRIRFERFITEASDDD